MWCADSVILMSNVRVWFVSLSLVKHGRNDRTTTPPPFLSHIQLANQKRRITPCSYNKQRAFQLETDLGKHDQVSCCARNLNVHPHLATGSNKSSRNECSTTIELFLSSIGGGAVVYGDGERDTRGGYVAFLEPTSVRKIIILHSLGYFLISMSDFLHFASDTLGIRSPLSGGED